MQQQQISEMEQRLVFAAIEFLERNDFTMIRPLGPHFLRARDGETSVFIWLDFGMMLNQIAVPVLFMDLAKDSRSRLDVIKFDMNDLNKASIKHMMNVGED